MKRFYLSKIIGDGSLDDPNGMGPYRPALADSVVAYAAVLPTDETGKPLHTHALCIVSSQNHGQLIADARNAVLPDFPLDGKLTAMQTATKAKMLQNIGAIGLDATAIGNSDGYRDALRAIGRQLGELSFDENNFDVA